jgi:hypothetical protein
MSVQEGERFHPVAGGVHVMTVLHQDLRFELPKHVESYEEETATALDLTIRSSLRPRAALTNTVCVILILQQGRQLGLDQAALTPPRPPARIDSRLP